MSERGANAEKQKRVLVVEDDSSLRELLSRSLERQGYQTVQASDGLEALDRFIESTRSESSDERIDAMVTDYFMPRMDGAALSRKIKALHADFPIILVTGEAPDAVVLELAGLSELVTLIKPFRPEALREALRRVLKCPLPDGRKESRKSTRVDVSISCTIDDKTQAVVRNLSFGGSFLETEEVFPVGSTFRFSLQGLERYGIAGKVMWSRTAGMGIAMMLDSPETDAFLKKFVLNKLKQMGVGIIGAGTSGPGSF